MITKDIKLSVPLVGQKESNNGKPLLQPDSKGRLVPHGFMACWFASACMVSYFYKAGPRLGLPKVWRADKGLNLQSISALAQIEGLKPILVSRDGLTRDTIYETLKEHGPIWAAGRYLDGYPNAGHVIVITGVQDTVVYYNDPWEPESKRREAEWIRTNVIDVHGALLVKDQSRS